MKKPRVAVVGFTGCAGCQLELLNLEELLDVIEKIELTKFRLAKSEVSEDHYELAFVEGSISEEAQIEELRNLRKQSKFLVALGSCASYGGVQSISNFINLEEAHKTVYGRKKINYYPIKARPLSAWVKVDFELPGCPIDRNEFLEVLKDLLLGKIPKPKPYPVCMECKLRENICPLVERNELCLGPVTRAGCEAKCPSNGALCEGCRGPVEEANIASEASILKEKGLDPKEIIRKFRMYCAGAKEFQEVK